MTKLMLLAPVLLAATPTAAQVMTPTEYVTTAGASDLYERTSSEVVLETTKDPRIRAFAQQMIAEHTRSTAQVKAAAVRLRVKAASPMLTPAQSELLAELRAEAGPARDMTYVAQQKASHGQALNVQKAYGMEGTAPALKATAAEIVPVVQHHIAMLMAM